MKETERRQDHSTSAKVSSEKRDLDFLHPSFVDSADVNRSFPRFSLKQWKVFIVNDPARNLASMLVGAPKIFEQNLYAPDQVA